MTKIYAASAAPHHDPQVTPARTKRAYAKGPLLSATKIYDDTAFLRQGIRYGNKAEFKCEAVRLLGLSSRTVERALASIEAVGGIANARLLIGSSLDNARQLSLLASTSRSLGDDIVSRTLAGDKIDVADASQEIEMHHLLGEADAVAQIIDGFRKLSQSEQ